MILQCPKCHSDNTQKLSIIYYGDTSGVELSTVGIGVERKGGVGVGISRSSGISQTLLANRYAPPEKKGFGCGVTMIIVAIIVGLVSVLAIENYEADWSVITMFSIALILLNIAIVNIYLAHQANKQFPVLYAEWNKKYLCLRCETVFIPDQDIQ